MAYTPPKTVTIDRDTEKPRYATCSGCPGVVLRWALRDMHSAWHAEAGATPPPDPEPDPEPEPTPTPPPPAPQAGLPAKLVGLYHMMWSNSGSPQLRTTPANVNVVNLAFAQGAPPNLTGWASQSEASFVAEAKTLRERGVKIVVSIGGAHGQVNTSNRTQFIDGIMAIHGRIPLDGIDWDLEGISTNLGDIVAISTALKQRIKPEFGVTLAPNGSNIGTYLPIAVALHKENALDMIAQQFYDAPVSEGAMMGRLDQAIGMGIPQNKLGVGMMVGTTTNYWTVDTCVSRVNAAKAKYPNLRGGYLWEAGRAGTADWAARVGPLLTR